MGGVCEEEPSITEEHVTTLSPVSTHMLIYSSVLTSSFSNIL
jgi:hypothetical protein